MASVRVQMNHRGAASILKSQEVRDYLTRLAERVRAAQAKRDPNARIWQDTTDRAAVRIGSTSPAALRREAKYGYLSRSLDAAAGGGDG